MATGKFSKLKEMQNSPEPGQRSAALLAIYLKNKDAGKKQAALDALAEQAKKDPTAMYFAVCGCVLAGDETNALGLITEAGENQQMLRYIRRREFPIVACELTTRRSNRNTLTKRNRTLCYFDLKFQEAKY
jgi:hypothetical protein